MTEEIENTEEKKVIKSKAKVKVQGFKTPVGWSIKDLEYLYSAREEGMQYSFIASALKKKISDVKRVYRETKWKSSPFYDAVLNRVKESVKQEYIESLVEAREASQTGDRIKLDIVCDRIEQAVKRYPVAPAAWTPETITEKKNRPEDIALVLSDTHFGHNHTLEETGGISEYNMKIARKQMQTVRESVVEIYQLHCKLYPIETLHIFCLGDIVAGMNGVGSWSSVYIDTPIYDQMTEGFEEISKSIYYWLGIFKNIKFYGIAGNHARSSEKGQEKDYCNWDYLCYKFIETRFKDEKRVSFTNPKAWWQVANIRNHKFLLLHGDDISGGSGSLAKLENATADMVGIIKQIPDYTIAGHFHSSAEMSTNYGKVIVNGAFMPGDMYSLKQLQKGSKPVQKIFGINDTRGITWSYDINLDK